MKHLWLLCSSSMDTKAHVCFYISRYQAPMGTQQQPTQPATHSTLEGEGAFTFLHWPLHEL
jgi:hypothetical protein